MAVGKAFHLFSAWYEKKAFALPTSINEAYGCLYIEEL